MAIEAKLIEKLGTKTELTSLVSTRIYPSERVPSQSSLPRVVYKEISSIPAGNLGGVVNYYVSLWQFDCLASTYDSAKAIAWVLYQALFSSIGSLGSGFTLVSVINPQVSDGNDLPQDGYSVGIARAILEVELTYAIG